MSKVIGHQKQKDLLAKVILNNNIPHAFLFTGGEQVGKKMFALNFAKMILCENNACGTCKTCLDIEKNISPDLCLIANGNDNIEIEKIREIREFLRLKSYSNKKKVAIIDNAHLIATDGQNSLLKLLEEPPENSILILITSFSEMILGTIKSRVQTINFNGIPNKEIEKYLISVGATEIEAQEISTYSSGKIGKAIELFKDSEKKEFFIKTLNYLKEIENKGFDKRFEYVKEIYKDPEDKEAVSEILNIFERFFRKIMFLKLYKKDSGSFRNHSLLQIKKIIEEIQSTKYYFNNTNTNKKLLLENLMINI